MKRIVSLYIAWLIAAVMLVSAAVGRHRYSFYTLDERLVRCGAGSGFDPLHAAILAGIPNGPQKTAGIVWGEFVANQILAARANDRSDAIVPPPGGSGPGVWVPTPPAFARMFSLEQIKR